MSQHSSTRLCIYATSGTRQIALAHGSPRDLRFRLTGVHPKLTETGGVSMARTVTIRRQTTTAAVTGASVIDHWLSALAVIGPSAMGPLAIAASAVGALADRRLAIADAVVRRLRAEEIEIGSLKSGSWKSPAIVGPRPHRLQCRYSRPHTRGAVAPSQKNLTAGPTQVAAHERSGLCFARDASAECARRRSLGRAILL